MKFRIDEKSSKERNRKKLYEVLCKDPVQQTENFIFPKIDDDDEIYNQKCAICYYSTEEAVVTSCGHVFCWSCIYKWYTTTSEKKTCPQCREFLSIEDVTSILDICSTDYKKTFKKNTSAEFYKFTKPVKLIHPGLSANSRIFGSSLIQEENIDGLSLKTLLWMVFIVILVFSVLLKSFLYSS